MVLSAPTWAILHCLEPRRAMNDGMIRASRVLLARRLMQCLPSIPNSNTRDKAQSTRHRSPVADVIATEAPGGGSEAPSDFIQATDNGLMCVGRLRTNRPCTQTECA